MGGLSQNQKPAGGLGALQQLPQQQQQANNVMTNNSGENAVCGLDYFYSSSIQIALWETRHTWNSLPFEHTSI